MKIQQAYDWRLSDITKDFYKETQTASACPKSMRKRSLISYCGLKEISLDCLSALQSIQRI